MMNEQEKFEKAFLQCIKDGVHPGPAELNDRMGKGRFNRLNGRLTRQRLYLMHEHSIPYKKGPLKGTIPQLNEML